MKALLQWGNVGNADGYYIYKSPTSSQGVRVGSSTTPSYTDEAIEPGRVYFYCVSAYNAGGESAPTAQDSISVPDDIAPPAVPQGLTVTLVP